MPWKVLGEKWHLAREGFSLGKIVRWDPKILRRLCRLLQKTAPAAEFDWTNQQVVHVKLPGSDETWCSLYTKRTAGIDLVLAGPKSHFAYGRIADLGHTSELRTEHKDKDVVKLRFVDAADVKDHNLLKFLSDHARAAANRIPTGSRRWKKSTR